MLFGTLYKHSRAKADSTQEWTISVVDNTYTVTYGKLNGKLQSQTTVISEGKNIGKKNETSPEQQAYLEAESKYKNQLRKGYVTDVNDTSKANLYEPMLAKKSQEVKKYPASFAYQEKLNGVRCVYDPGEKCLWTRGNLKINTVPHILAECLQYTIPLDGELLLPGSGLDKLKGVVDRDDLHDDYKSVTYNVFDTCFSGTFKDRWQLLLNTVKPNGIIQLVTTRFDNDPAKFNEYFNQVAADGGEGIIIRNAKGLYKPGARSADLIKMKNFEDAEFKIIGGFEDKNGNCVFTCQTDAGVQFNVTPEGSFEQKRLYLDTLNECIGKYLNVRHVGWTADGIPFHAVGVYIREEREFLQTSTSQF